MTSERSSFPTAFHFFARQQPAEASGTSIVCMDQSGSMADSVVYGGVMGAIFASLPALETHVIVFDTEVVDLTEKCHDPVDLLFGVQLGGGTDINRAVGLLPGAHPRPAQDAVHSDHRPVRGRQRTRAGAAGRGDRRVAACKLICLLALADSGMPSHDENLAKKLANLGVPCFGLHAEHAADVARRRIEGTGFAPAGGNLFRQTPVGETPMSDLALPVLVLWIGGIVGGLLGFFLSVLLFRAACDLVSVEPPSWLKSAGIVLLLNLLNVPLSFAIGLGVGLMAKALNLGPEWSFVLGFLVALPFNALLAALLYMFLLRVRFFKGALIWVLQSLLGLLVGGVTLFLIIGVWTIADGVRRLW